MKKKIVIVGTAHPLRGGIASFNERIARAFMQQGYEVIIYTFKLQYPSFLFPGKTQYSEDPPPHDLNIEILINSINPFNWIRSGLKIRQEKADVYLCKFWIPFIGPCLGTIFRLLRTGKSKRVSIIDNIIPHEKRPFDFILSKYFAKSIDKFIVMSKSVEKDMIKFTAAPVKYVPHPIYDNYGEIIPKALAKAHLKLSDKPRIMLFFGFIRDYKGLDLLLKAMADPLLKDQQIHCLIAGEYYGNEPYYRELIAELGIIDSLSLHSHFISNEEVKYYFSAADLVVQPYKTATQSGITQLAYHFEKPMIVTHVGGLPELVENGKAGYVVEVNESAIAKAIYRFYDKDQEAEFSSFVKSQKDRFSWDNMVEEIVKQ